MEDGLIGPEDARAREAEIKRCEETAPELDRKLDGLQNSIRDLCLNSDSWKKRHYPVDYRTAEKADEKGSGSGASKSDDSGRDDSSVTAPNASAFDDFIDYMLAEGGAMPTLK